MSRGSATLSGQCPSRSASAHSPFARPSGHVFRVDRHRGPVWYAKFRVGDDRQIQKALGPAWSGRGRPPAGFFTKRLAEDWLRDTLDQARRETLPGMVRTGARFADAAAEWLRYIEHDRGRKPTTVIGYQTIVRACLLPTFADKRLEDVSTEMVERWLASFDRAPSTRAKALVCMHGIFVRARKVWGLRLNPVADVEKPTLAAAATSRSSHRRRSWASCAPPPASRTPRST